MDSGSAEGEDGVPKALPRRDKKKGGETRPCNLKRQEYVHYLRKGTKTYRKGHGNSAAGTGKLRANSVNSCSGANFPLQKKSESCRS